MMDAKALDLDQLPDDVSAGELRSAVANRAEPLRARLALKALAQRFPEAAVDEARSIVKDRGAADDLRSTAAVELGRRVDAASEDVLLNALRDARPGVVKHLVASLGRIGGKQALDSLEKLPVPDDGPARAALSFAKTLISYRIGSRAYLLKPDQADLKQIPVISERTVLQFSELQESKLEDALPSIQRQLPALPVARRSGVRFVCGNGEYWMLLHEDVAQAGTIDKVKRQPMIIGAILKFRACSDHYSLDEYLFTNGGERDRVALIGGRPSGVIVHAGEVVLGERSAAFELRSCNPPYSQPIDLRGHFEAADGRLSFSRALAGTSGDMRAKVPARRVLA